uniref:Uncharacterized protein n=1 Tax=Anguilla anguilla TaxID=7936 RepID=A0A0E9PDJ8_ANGAN
MAFKINIREVNSEFVDSLIASCKLCLMLNIPKSFFSKILNPFKIKDHQCYLGYCYR